MASATNNQPPRQVLFVDDEPDFLLMVKEIFGVLSAGHWCIHGASTTDAALELLKHQKLDLVVVDVNMPGLDGIQFLKILQEQHPGLKKVTLTAFVTEEKRTECLASGAELFIEKPKTTDGFKSVFAMLDDLISWLPRANSPGTQRRVSLQDVIQMECLGRNSSVLEVYNDQVLGRIYLEAGSLIHAAAADLIGERALQKLLTLPGGSFELVPFEAPAARTLHASWETLLAEAVRVREAQAAAGTTLNAEGEPVATVAETLICSGAGEPVYEFQCADAQSRVRLLQNIAHHAAQLAHILPLGNFDRLEMQLAAERIIAQSRPDRLVYVRVADSPSAA